MGIGLGLGLGPDQPLPLPERGRKAADGSCDLAPISRSAVLTNASAGAVRSGSIAPG